MSWETRRPATLAARTTWRDWSSSRSRRTSSTSASSDGHPSAGAGRRRRRAPRRRTRCPRPGSTMSATSSSLDRARGAARGSGCGRRARSAAGAGGARRRGSGTTPPPGVRSGCRRWRSSERYDATTATGPSKGRVNRKLSMSRVDWSAQWVSSMTSSTGAFSAVASSRPCTASNRSARSSADAVAGLGRAEHPPAGLEPGQGRVDAGDGADDVGEVDGQPAEHLGEREVGQRAVAEVEAVAGEHLPALLDREVAELGEQAGLADPGVTGQQDGAAGVAVGRQDGRRAAKQAPPARRPVPPGSGSCAPSRGPSCRVRRRGRSSISARSPPRPGGVPGIRRRRRSPRPDADAGGAVVELGLQVACCWSRTSDSLLGRR